LCLNFVEGGECYATKGKCVLGARGTSANNDTLECELQGSFDVWVMQDDKLLVSDLGIPSAEPKQCLALGINKKLAIQIAKEKSGRLGTVVSTTERTCFFCNMPFWMSEHDSSHGITKTERGYFCPSCFHGETEENLVRKLGILGYWCG
jgi:hypothetical protein